MVAISLNPTNAASISGRLVFGLVLEDVTQAYIFSPQGQWNQEVIGDEKLWMDQALANSTNTPISIGRNLMTQAEIEFLEQKEAFLLIPPIPLAQYQGQYVVSHNGEILDHDPDLPTLTARFFETHGDVPVYITKIGEEVDDRFDTPFFD